MQTSPFWMESLVGEAVESAEVDTRPLRGGLDSVSVDLVTVRYRTATGRRSMLRYVRKRLLGSAIREAVVYRDLAERYARDCSPRLYAVEGDEQGHTLLCIEAIRRTSAWPWRDLGTAHDMLDQTAKFHLAAKQAPASVTDWDYEKELSDTASHTVAASASKVLSDSRLARTVRPARSLVDALPRLRRELFHEQPFGCSPIHGDIHTGNAVVCRRGGRSVPILVDWAARVSDHLWRMSARGLPPSVFGSKREGVFMIPSSKAT